MERWCGGVDGEAAGLSDAIWIPVSCHSRKTVFSSEEEARIISSDSAGMRPQVEVTMSFRARTTIEISQLQIPGLS